MQVERKLHLGLSEMEKGAASFSADATENRAKQRID